MKAIKEYDAIIEGFQNGERYDREDVDNFDLFNAYYKSIVLAKNRVLDFHDVLWEDSIPSIVDCMIEHGIWEFTISCSYSGIQNVVAKFMDSGYGATIDGMKDVYTGQIGFDGNPETAPAFVMHLIDPSQF